MGPILRTTGQGAKNDYANRPLTSIAKRTWGIRGYPLSGVARRVGASRSSKSNGATLGFEAKLWQAADLLRNNLDAAQYKHVVLGLIFLKYISDAFEER